MFQSPARARLVQPAGEAGVAGADDLGRARLRFGHHAGWTARPVLRRAAWSDVARPNQWSADHSGLLSSRVETAFQKLGSISGSTALFALRNDSGKTLSRST